MKHCIRYLLSLLVVTATLVVVATTPVQAHVLESDGDISAVLHIPPDDAPAAGRNTTLRLAFASDRSGFNLAAYNSTVTIKRGNETVQVAKLTADGGSGYDGFADITLPEPGAYRLEVTGRPMSDGESFQLSFSIRASAAAGSEPTNNRIAGVAADFWVLNICLLLIVCLIAQYAIRLGGRYSNVTAKTTTAAGKHKKPVQH